MSGSEQIDPAEEAAAEQRDTTGEPSPVAAPAAPSTPGPVGDDAAPGPGSESGTSGEHRAGTGPKLFAAALLVAVLIVWLRRH